MIKTYFSLNLSITLRTQEFGSLNYEFRIEYKH